MYNRVTMNNCVASIGKWKPIESMLRLTNFLIYRLLMFFVTPI